MSTAQEEFLMACELQSVARIKAVLDDGLDPLGPVRGKLPVHWLTEMYVRSDRFPECLRLLLERGAELDDPKVAPVLLDDAEALAAAVRRDASLLEHRTTMVSAFTPLVGASLLHVAAEYGNRNAARTLVDLGADVNARASVDDFGLGGHTPLFHTVNSHDNRSVPILGLLLDAGARTDVRLWGLTWGMGFDWETTVFDITPVSYAQLGLLPQMHREERHIYDNIRLLLEAGGRNAPSFGNVPNRYLRPRRDA